MLQRGEQRQTQGLIISQRMQQALKLLHLSNVELQSHLSDILADNPFLELGTGKLQDNEAITYGADPRTDDLTFDEEKSRAQANEFDSDGMGSIAANPPSLHEHLLRQLHISTTDREELLIGTMMIDAIDDSGYLQELPESFAERAGISADKALLVHALIMTFDPTGVGARNPEECLAMQLRERDQMDAVAAAILRNLHILAKRDYKSLAKICNCTHEVLQEKIAQIRRLNPKPGHAVRSETVQSIIPDLIVRRISGVWHVEMNETGMPRVGLNRDFYQKARLHSKSDEHKNFVHEHYRIADWLVKSLDKREKTILRVAGEIVRLQQGFFDYGAAHLHPLTLKSVAQSLELHESTVSRVTAGKYLRCPRGIFELKFFFMSGVSGDENDPEAHISSETVKFRIRNLIDNEPAQTPLSDDELCAELARIGIRVARRTVSKYRESMKIAGYRERKRLNKK